MMQQSLFRVVLVMELIGFASMRAGAEESTVAVDLFSADQTPSDHIDAGVIEGGFFLATGGDLVSNTPVNTSLSRTDVPRRRPDVPGSVLGVSLVPRPVRLNLDVGEFTFRADTQLVCDESSRPIAEYLADRLRPATGWALARVDAEEDTNTVVFRLEDDDALGPEGYRLRVSEESVRLIAPRPAGLFYGVQTLLQLMPVDVFGTNCRSDVRWTVPALTVEDYPRFGWRGLMLDSCRHFLPVETVKTFIDLMALHKLNVLHWHLTEDQGWRIEIKKYPRLTQVGSIRAESPRKGQRNQGDGTPYGPYFYTQDDIRHVVAYAASRSITVVPEIELPGHSRAALAAYPDLGCTGEPYEVRTAWGVEPDIYCAGKDEVFRFLEDVLSEVISLFPSPILHICGDEAPKARWEACERCQARIEAEGLQDEHELQSYFTTRIETYLNTQGRRLIGWDEILEGGLAPNASVMSWRGEGGGIAAAQAGHDVVMSPTSHCYFDYAQSRNPGEPESIGGFIPLSRVYAYNPVPEVLSVAESQHILGVQGNLWSEYLFEPADVEYMAFPRACALAEVAWTPREQMDYADFRVRLPRHLTRLDALGVNYRPLSQEADEGDR